MKILFSAGQYPTAACPFASFIAGMAKAFAEYGHDVTVVAPQSITRAIFRNSLKFLPFYEEVSNHKYKFPIKIYRPRTFTFGEGKLRGRLTIKNLKRATKHFLNSLNSNFDIAYCHFWQSAYQIMDYVDNHHLPLVISTGEDTITISRYLRDFEKLKLQKLASRLICVSTKNKEESIDLGLINDNKCLVLPNGPDLTTFKKLDKNLCRKELGLPLDKFIVCFVGRFINRKGPLRVEDAILDCSDKEIKAIFIGSVMSDEDRSQEPKGSEILFKGVIPHYEVSQYLSASDLFVLPTLAEGCSNSIVEAMACGLPIVSSNLSFNYDILDSSNSILIDPLNIEDISNAIKRLKNNPELCKAMSEASIIKAHKLDFRLRVEKILQILKDHHNN